MAGQEAAGTTLIRRRRTLIVALIRWVYFFREGISWKLPRNCSHFFSEWLIRVFVYFWPWGRKLHFPRYFAAGTSSAVLPSGDRHGSMFIAAAPCPTQSEGFKTRLEAPILQ